MIDPMFGQIVGKVYDSLVRDREAQMAAEDAAGQKGGGGGGKGMSQGTSSDSLGTRGEAGGSSLSDRVRSGGNYGSLMGNSLMGSKQFTKAEVARGYRKIKA